MLQIILIQYLKKLSAEVVIYCISKFGKSKPQSTIFHKKGIKETMDNVIAL
jgi:hypothetical protein